MVRLIRRTLQILQQAGKAWSQFQDGSINTDEYHNYTRSMMSQFQDGSINTDDAW